MTGRTGVAERKTQRASHLQWVRIGEMRVSPKAQREFQQSHAEKFAADFDLEGFGFPIVNHRDDHYYIVDGQHRVAALRLIGFDEAQQIQCECYEGLSEAGEAELFLRRDDRKAIPALDKFRIAITAGREVECAIADVVHEQGLVVTRDNVPGAIMAPGTLRRVYMRSDGKTLGRALCIAKEAYGDSGLEAAVIDGLGLLCQRYDGELDQTIAVQRLGKINGGVHGLLGKAETLRRITGNQKGHCVAAAAVEIINAGRGGKKLAKWWT